MKRLKYLLLLTAPMACLLLAGCSHRTYEEITAPEPIVVQHGGAQESSDADDGEGEQESEPEEEELIVLESEVVPVKVKVKGIYISAYVAGTDSMMDDIIAHIDESELNAIVIDLKEDYGRIVCEMDSELINDVGSVKQYIPHAKELIEKLHDHDIYVIARVPAFRDAWLGTARPDWCVQVEDGSVFHDRDGNAWVNPYKEEAWDYLVEIGREAKKLGFDEIQFDYVRFCTESGMKNAVFSEEDTLGRTKSEIILESVAYIYEKLKETGINVSADVFGGIINSDVDAQSVGQIYTELAKHLDTISPMVYPSHYADWNYGIEHPDLNPYQIVYSALDDSREQLTAAAASGEHIADVRPWLQDFTASWLAHYQSYGAAQVREQIQGVYDAGYDEWLLWDASNKYSWGALKTPQEALEEEIYIAESRADEEQRRIEESLAALEAESIAESQAAEERLRELEELEEQKKQQDLEEEQIEKLESLEEQLKMQELESLEARLESGD